MSFIDQLVQPENREEAAFLHALSASMEKRRNVGGITARG
ncbi:carbon starvation induced protein CsiD [Cupriavidus necator]|nr:carbon starvation induced protein CsiD [Cupriavidus necator]